MRLITTVLLSVISSSKIHPKTSKGSGIQNLGLSSLMDPRKAVPAAFLSIRMRMLTSKHLRCLS